MSSGIFLYRKILSLVVGRAKSMSDYFAAAEVSIFLDSKNVADVKKWILESLVDSKLDGMNLQTVEGLYHSILYGKFGNWSKDEVSFPISLMALCS